MALFKGTVRMSLRLVLLVPLLVAVVAVNYFVDQTGLFRGDKYELELAQILLAGDPVSNFDQMDERQVLKLYIKNMAAADDTMVIGSSRGLQIDAAVAGATGSFYNLGMSGEDFYDIVGTISLLSEYDRLPKNLIMVLDPWILNTSEGSYSKRSDPNAANEFLTNTLGFSEPYTAEEKGKYSEALVDLDYFQKNVAYYFADHSDEERPARVTGDVCAQETPTKLPDGTLLYEESFRNWDQDKTDYDALTRANMPFSFGCDNYFQLNTTRCAEFEALIDFLQQRGVSLTFVLSPFHPTLYASAVAAKDTGTVGIMLSEEYFGKLAAAKGIPLYGSYDPAKANCTNADFYDGIHVRRERIRNYFPGIHTASA